MQRVHGYLQWSKTKDPKAWRWGLKASTSESNMPPNQARTTRAPAKDALDAQAGAGTSVSNLTLAMPISDASSGSKSVTIPASRSI